ncbi:hypothetical protein [Senegalia massiliensis]|uniref:hypothetical protein n=1 Tax=Senegalia massiliensis TaxID=1720316 RepID=UPI0010322ADD|nr:hypothetical protein [Senegalia massiliensis]
MGISELYNILKQVNLPIAYSNFTNPPELPYIIYFVEGSDNFLADNEVYFPISDCIIELYSNKKSIADEEKIETIFYENKIIWQKYETYINAEKLYQVSYEIQI